MFVKITQLTKVLYELGAKHWKITKLYSNGILKNFKLKGCTRYKVQRTVNSLWICLFDNRPANCLENFGLIDWKPPKWSPLIYYKQNMKIYANIYRKNRNYLIIYLIHWCHKLRCTVNPRYTTWPFLLRFNLATFFPKNFISNIDKY